MATLYAALSCAHFGHCRDLFSTALAGDTKEEVLILKSVFCSDLIKGHAMTLSKRDYIVYNRSE